MDFYVQNIDNNDKNTWRKIYETVYEPYFVEVVLFSKKFLSHSKNNPNMPQNIPY